MNFNWKKGILSAYLSSSMIFGFSQTKENNHVRDSILAKLEKYPTTTHYIYKLHESSKYNFHNVPILEKIIGNIEKKFPKKEKYSREETINVLSEIGKELINLKIKYKKDKFDCDDLSFIYLAVGEKLDIPFYAVLAPQHAFIRYDADGKHNAEDPLDSVNKGDFNWEPIVAGILSDRQYKEWRNISNESVKNKVYLKNLEKHEILSIVYESKGTESFINMDYESAVKNYNLAIELNPTFFGAYFNRGILYCDFGDYASGIKNFSKAIKLDPEQYESYKLRGYAYRKAREFKKAKADMEKFRGLKKADKMIKKAEKRDR